MILSTVPFAIVVALCSSARVAPELGIVSSSSRHQTRFWPSQRLFEIYFRFFTDFPHFAHGPYRYEEQRFQSLFPIALPSEVVALFG